MKGRLVAICLMGMMGCGPGATPAAGPASAVEVRSTPAEVAVVPVDESAESTPSAESSPSDDAGENDVEIEPDIEETESADPIETAEAVDVAIDTGGEPDASDDPGADEARLAAMRRRGRAVYERRCESCHDDGPRLVGRALGSGLVRRQVRRGGRRMRPIPPARLSERDLAAICAFLGPS